VAGHVAVKPEADGMRWWGGVRGDSQRYEHGDRYDGLVPAGLFGLDWTRGDLVYGAYAGYGSGKQDFGLSRGSFKQTDTSLGGFVGWYGDGVWVNGQLGYSWLGFDVDRNVQLGPATRRHSGSPDGTNLSVGIGAGYDFGEGHFKHGPVLSLLSQQIKVDGYEEGNPSATALRYGDQEFDSLIGSLGWQASYAANASLVPYARLTYDREFEKAPEQAFAQLQSITGLSPYAVPGLEMDRDYASLTLGARTHLFGLEADLGLSTTLGQKGGANATIFASVGGSF
jgi:outer membrane lipase/esterase